MSLQDWLDQAIKLRQQREDFPHLIELRCEWIEDRIFCGLADEGEASRMAAGVTALFEQWEKAYEDWLDAAPDALSVEDVVALV